MAGFAALGGDIVLKPLFGAEGRGITRLNDEALAQRAFSLLVNLGAVLYLQEFVAHDGMDLRVLLIGDRAFGMQRRNPLDWRTNVSRGNCRTTRIDGTTRRNGALRSPSDWRSGRGRRSTAARDGVLYTIEVNAVPGWQALSRVTGVDIAREVLEFSASRSGSRV